MTTFTNPPLNEVVFSIGFPDLYPMRAEHIGLFWDLIRNEYPISEQTAPVGGISTTSEEVFPLARFWFISSDNSELVQLQRNRLMLNWRQSLNDTGYPRYPRLFERFRSAYARFKSFVSENSLGLVEPSSYELSYINHLDENSDISSVSDLKTVISNITVLLPADHDYSVDGINCLQTYKYSGPNVLKLHVQPVTRRRDGQRVVQYEIQTHADIAEQEKIEMQPWFDDAHARIVQTFRGTTNPDIQRRCWGLVEKGAKP